MPSDKAVLAREHLERAAPHIGPDGDVTQALTWLHLAAEAAVDAMAAVHGIDTKKSHPLKAKAATQLYEDGYFSVSLEDTLLLLNEARKGTNYDALDPDLGDISTEKLYKKIETAVEEAEKAS